MIFHIFFDNSNEMGLVFEAFNIYMKFVYILNIKDIQSNFISINY